MSLHNSKRIALLQLTNCLPSCNINAIKQLFDGKLFYSQIETLFPEILCQWHSLEKQNAVECEGQLPNERLESTAENTPEDNEMIIETSNLSLKDDDKTRPGPEQIESPTHESNEPVVQDTKSGPTLTEPDPSESNSESCTRPDDKPSDDNRPVVEPVRFTECDNDDISKRYKLIKYFVDVKYQFDSETVIDFSACQNANEFELAKVAVFILTEVIRYYINTDLAVIETLQMLDNKVQQDLEQCFNFCINERSKISQEEIKKLLSNHGSYKVSDSPNRSNFITPKRSCSSKYKRPLSPSPSSKETVYSDSPLKAYFESPIFTQADIKIKETEILRTRQILYEEELRSCNLQQKVEELEKKLQNKVKEINDLKARNKEFLETTIPEKPENCESCKTLESQLSAEKRHFEEYEKIVNEDKEQLSKICEDKLLHLQTKFAESLIQIRYEYRKAEEENKQLEELRDDLYFQIYKGEDTIKILNEKLDKMVTECEILKEKLNEAEEKVKEPECPVIGECIGRYIEEENQKLLEEIKELKLKMHKEDKNKIFKDAMVQCIEENSDSSVKIDSNLSETKQASPDKVCEEKKLQNLKNTKGVDKECPNICDILNKHYTRSKSCAGSHSTVPSSKGHHTSVTNSNIGSLWHQYNNSMSENANTDVVPESDKFAKEVMEKISSGFSQIQKLFSTPCGPNGSNGFLSPPVSNKELVEIVQSLLCLLQSEESQVKFQNNNSISKNTVTIDETQCNSSSEVHSKCVTCSKELRDVQNCDMSTNQDSVTLKEKNQEIENLQEKYKNATMSLKSVEKELAHMRRKYSFLKNVNQESQIKFKTLCLKLEKIEMELKNAKYSENEAKRNLEKEKSLFKMQFKEMKERFQKINRNISEYRDKNIALAERNSELEQDLISSKTRNDELSLYIQNLEKQIEDINAPSRTVPSKNKIYEDKVIPIIKEEKEKQQDTGSIHRYFPESEFISPNKYDIFLRETSNDESTLSGALHRRSIHSGFHYITDDEEAFLNHSSIAEINKGYESTDVQNSFRRHELQRRNTMYAPHLQSCYPAEGPFATPLNKNLSSRAKSTKAESLSIGHRLQNDMPVAKKARLTENLTKDQSSEYLHTPAVKTKRSFKTPSSLQRLFARKRRPIKPLAEK